MASKQATESYTAAVLNYGHTKLIIMVIHKLWLYSMAANYSHTMTVVQMYHINKR